MKPLCLIYFGADNSWEQLKQSGFSRRNTNLLKAFAEHQDIDLVVNAQFRTRLQWIASCFSPKQHKADSVRMVDFGVVAFFPSFLLEQIVGIFC